MTNRSEWEQFQQLWESRVPPVQLTHSQQELYFRLVTLNFFPQLSEIAEAAAEKGEEYHPNTPNEMYGFSSKMGVGNRPDYLSFAEDIKIPDQ